MFEKRFRPFQVIKKLKQDNNEWSEYDNTHSAIPKLLVW